MAEIVIPDNYVTQVPSFLVPKMPKELSNAEVPEKPAIPAAPEVAKPAVEAPAPEGAEPEQAEPLTTGKDPEKPVEEEKPSNRRFERRIDRATKARAQAEAKAEALAREVAELKAKQQAPADPQAPKMENYTDIEEYAKAKAEYAVKQETKAREEKQQQEQGAAARKTLLDNWTEASVRGEDKYDDFAEVVGELQPTTPWAIAIMKSDNSADVAYYLGKHLKEAQKIIALDPFSQILAIGNLSTKLSAAPVAPKQPSKAPPPINPVTGSAAVSEAGIKSQMPYEEYMKVRKKVFPRGR